MTTGSPPRAFPSDRVVLAAFLLVLVAIPLLVADRQSFWIDEAMTWRITRIEDPGAVWHEIRTSLSSEALIPGYLFYAWAWTRLGGEGEAWSRVSNLPWLALLGWVWWNWGARAYPQDRIRRLAFLALLLVSPFVLWYATEYRPYAAVIALGALTVEGISRAAGGSRAGPWIATGAALLAAAFHMLALALFTCLALQVLWGGRRNLLRTLRSWWVPALIAAIPLLAGLAAYYLGSTGSGASGMRAPLSLKNPAFIYYEFIGFLGLGPTRDALHVDSGPAIFMAALPTLALLLIPLAILAAMVLLAPPAVDRRPPAPEVREILRAGLVFGVGGVLLLCVAAYLVNFKILGRHVAFFQPPLLAAGAILILDRSLARVGLPWAALLVALGISSGRLFLDPVYERDDYRGAVELTRQLAGLGTTQLLMGDRGTFQYYRPAAVVVEPPTIPQGPELAGEVVIVGLWRPSWEVVADALPGPVVLALTRPYYYDASGEVRRWAIERGGRVVDRPAYFEIWWVPARSRERDRAETLPVAPGVGAEAEPDGSD